MTQSTSFDLWLEFEHWEPLPGDDPTDEFANVVVLLPDGRRYALNVWTFQFIHRARLEDDPDVPAEYLLPPDLFVERLDRPTMERVVRQLLARDEMRAEWLCPPSDEPSDEGDA
ncbi:hypothetical protein [Nannocystis punicea]|uniref:Uncharacterized protein n=1 Tax=Nannocystis punicea TaxID=2995304 RepID=A0ABY7GU12_9BACT|nr:hypothetical protein [Nannocystis poenicansa]WAS90369.1 hypothetical protein O0S08_29630 [Nannocystis poenicansa]